MVGEMRPVPESLMVSASLSPPLFGAFALGGEGFPEDAGIALVPVFR